MNSAPEKHTTPFDKQIDAALRLIGSAHPRPGIEQRITSRLAAAPAARIRFFGLPRLAIASAAAMVACVAIVGGSVSHSRHQLAVAPGVPLPATASGGMSTASAQKVASRPVTPPSGGRPRSMRKLSDARSIASPESQKSNGIAVPKAPVPR